MTTAKYRWHKVGPENKVGPESQVGPENKVGPTNHFEISWPSCACGSICLVKLVSTNPFSHHNCPSWYEMERSNYKCGQYCKNQGGRGHYLYWVPYTVLYIDQYLTILTNINKYWQLSDKNTPFWKRACRFSKNIKAKNAGGRLWSRKQLLGLPIHMKILWKVFNIRYYITLVLNALLYMNYI